MKFPKTKPFAVTYNGVCAGRKPSFHGTREEAESYRTSAVDSAAIGVRSSQEYDEIAGSICVVERESQSVRTMP